MAGMRLDAPQPRPRSKKRALNINLKRAPPLLKRHLGQRVVMGQDAEIQRCQRDANRRNAGSSGGLFERVGDGCFGTGVRLKDLESFVLDVQFLRGEVEDWDWGAELKEGADDGGADVARATCDEYVSAFEVEA